MRFPAACLGLLLGAAAADPSARAAGLGWAGVSVDAHSLLQEWAKHGIAARAGSKVVRPRRHAEKWDEADVLKRMSLGRRPHKNYEINGNDMTELFGSFKEYNQALIISNTFTHFDVNGDKKLDRKEIDTLLYYLGERWPDDKVNQIMADLDHVIPDELVQLSEFFFWFTWPTIESAESLKTKMKSMQDKGRSRTRHRGLVADREKALDSTEIIALNTTDPETVLNVFGKFTQYGEVLRIMYFFKVFDLDWDMKMAQSEFVHLLKYLNMGNWTQHDIDMLMDGLDVLKKDGEVELNEFLYWFTPAFTNIWEAKVQESISLAPEGSEPGNQSNLSNASEQVVDLMKELNELAASVNESLKVLPNKSEQSLRESLPRDTSPSSKGLGASMGGFSQYRQVLIIVNVFAHFDKNADDKLNQTEMLDVLNYLGEYWSSEQLDQLMTDLDHVIVDGAVQASEFLWWFTSIDINRAQNLQQEVENMKNHRKESVLDAKGKAFAAIKNTDIVVLDSDRIPLNPSDVLAVFGKFSQFRESLKVLFFFHTFDLDQDRHIDQDEFVKLLQILEPGAWTYDETLALVYNLDALKLDGVVELNEFFFWFTPTFKHVQEAAIHEAAQEALLKKRQGS